MSRRGEPLLSQRPWQEVERGSAVATLSEPQAAGTILSSYHEETADENHPI